MPGLTKPDSFVTASDKRLVAISGVVAGMALWGVYPIVPLPVAVVMTVVPVLIHFGIHINQQVKFDDALREQRARKKTKKMKKLLYRCRYRPHEDGTSWEIVNANPFAWTNTKLLIERSYGDEKVTEKIHLGDIPPGVARSVEANIVDIETARWRVLMISNEGQHVDFPDKWREDPWLSPNILEAMNR